MIETSDEPERHEATRGGLDIRDLSMGFKRGDRTYPVIERLSLNVAPGEFISVVGPSGCGKTTLLRIVAGLIAPTEGTVTANGRLVTGPDRNRPMVFQKDNLLPWRTVIGNVLFGIESMPIPRVEAEARARELIRIVGLSGYEDHYPRELSGGMRQRVNLARALAVSPQMLLMDEPFAALDAQTREVMQTELLRVWNQDKKTVVFVTHQIDEAVFLSDRVVVLAAKPGRMIEDVHVILGRPRSLDTKRTSDFVGYVDRIWKLIEKQVFQDVETGNE